MSDPLAGGLVGFQTSEKGIDFGWARGQDQEQFYERLTRNLRQIDAGLKQQWGWNPRLSLDLNYAFFGGIVDDGVEWLQIPAGSVTLTNNTTNFVERNEATGVVRVNLVEFTYPTQIPMAEIIARNGKISEYTDRRPQLGGALGGAGGCTDFPCLMGEILDNQVPLSAVLQYLTRDNLPSEIAYEDEGNVFTERQELRGLGGTGPAGVAPTLSFVETDVVDNNLDMIVNDSRLEFWRVNDDRNIFSLMGFFDITTFSFTIFGDVTVGLTLFTDNIKEESAGAGVVIDGLNLEDFAVFVSR